MLSDKVLLKFSMDFDGASRRSKAEGTENTAGEQEMQNLDLKESNWRNIPSSVSALASLQPRACSLR